MPPQTVDLAHAETVPRSARSCLSSDRRVVRMVNVMRYRVAAGVVLVIHLLVVLFVVGGAFLCWRWNRGPRR